MKPHSLLAAMLLSSAVLAQDNRHPYDIAKDVFDKQLAQEKSAAKGNDDLLVLDYVQADRKTRRATLMAVATGVSDTEPVEFFVATGDSGKDYESLSITFAKPSDVDRALRFIGLEPGRPVNYEKNQQWPRGPRVTMTLIDGDRRVLAEDCVINTETNTTLPRAGLVYVGSYQTDNPDGGKALAADVDEAKPIAPFYNDPAAVLDVPERAAQGAVYGFLKANPKQAFKLGQLLRIEIEPAAGEAAVNSRDITIDARPDGPGRYVIHEAGATIASAANLPELVAALAELARRRDDLFCTVRLDAAMPVDDARKLFAVLMSVEQDRGIKLEPSPDGLFHKAYFPEPEWRERENRLGEPWELFLYRDNGKLLGRLERQTENHEQNAPEQFSLERTEIVDPATFVKAINAKPSQWTKAVFVYPPADLTVGELNLWVMPALPSYPRIFVFPATSPTQPATRPS